MAVYKAYGRKNITLAESISINMSKGSDLECTLTRDLCVLKIQNVTVWDRAVEKEQPAGQMYIPPQTTESVLRMI